MKFQLLFKLICYILGRQKKKDKYKQMKNEPHKKTGKVSPYPGGKYKPNYVNEY